MIFDDYARRLLHSHAQQLLHAQVAAAAARPPGPLALLDDEQ
jgi:hypothetical protein